MEGMLTGRFHLPGLMAALFALVAHLAVGASIPRMDPLAAATPVLCHAVDASDGDPAPAPAHSTDCPLCPLCGALHAPPVVLVHTAVFAAPSVISVAIGSELPPPSIAPPGPRRLPAQPRAPPVA
jgi:hypothetical protein